MFAMPILAFRLPIVIVVSAPVILDLLTGPCYLDSKSHSLLMNCGQEIFSLEEFFKSAYACNGHFWRILAKLEIGQLHRTRLRPDIHQLIGRCRGDLQLYSANIWQLQLHYECFTSSVSVPYVFGECAMRSIAFYSFVLLYLISQSSF